MLRREDDGRVVCERCVIADTLPRRLRGLLGVRGLPAGEGIVLRPGWSIHTAFMRFPIDAVFVDEDGRVLRVAERLKPWRAAAVKGASAVVELPAGTAETVGIAPGQRLLLPA